MEKESVTVVLAADLKRWLEAQSAQRMADGVEHGKRSINAVVVDIIEAARDASETQERAVA